MNIRHAAGFALLLTLDAHSAYAAMLRGFALTPFGMGLAVPAMTASVLAGVARERAGTASAVLNAARQAGGAAGVALLGALAGGNVVAGLHLSVAICAALSVAAAALAGLGLPRRRAPM